MYRIDNSSAATSIPTPAAVGPKPNGFFTKGNPGAGVPATIVDDDFLNAVQEEICNVITTQGITLSKTARNQLITALDARYLALSKVTPVVNFRVNTTTAIPIATGVPHQFILSNIIKNHGNCYDSTTGNFTAQYKGTYLFFLSAEYTNLSGASFGSLYDYIYLNGAEVAIGDRYYPTTNPNSDSIPASTLIDLEIGDVISTYANYTGFTAGSISPSNETYFYGYLINLLP